MISHVSHIGHMMSCANPDAYIAFETEQTLNHAMTTSYALGKNTL